MVPIFPSKVINKLTFNQVWVYEVITPGCLIILEIQHMHIRNAFQVWF